MDKPPVETRLKDEPDFEAIGVLDGRRGLWMRVMDHAVEMCAGREGDDAYFKLGIGETFTFDHASALVEVMRTLRYAFETAEENKKSLTEEQFADMIDEWNNSDSNTAFHVWAGMTWEQYQKLAAGRDHNLEAT